MGAFLRMGALLLAGLGLMIVARNLQAAPDLARGLDLLRDRGRVAVLIGEEVRLTADAAGPGQHDPWGRASDEEARLGGLVRFQEAQSARSKILARFFRSVGAPAPVEACARTYVHVSEVYGFLYVKLAGKTAGTSIQRFFFEAALCGLFCPGASTQMVPATEWWTGDGKSSECLRCLAERRLWYTTTSHAPAVNTSRFLKFTAVRDPYRRALSSYMYCMSSPRWGVGRRAARAAYMTYSFEDFLRAPEGMANYTRQPRGHWRPQAECLAGAGVRGYDYVLCADRLAEEMPHVVRAINARRAPALPPLPPFGRIFAQTGAWTGRPLSNLSCPGAPGGSCEAAVRASKYYAQDLGWFAQMCRA